ncbi:MAG: leucine-rich repeat protein [Paludibacter sp.]|nr:leucine-rich repeat protein [Bacteroidales bacterium]MCM1068744.1 leucine-rich repeat protein [Prevotella sp.]MCM1354456.1 leucine-rich repeat protein [Bacteroides sp.]MCM1443259.1 leucine-rich repeat protein [Muribaculum sp.]MCM1481056.1 leucine-rich repeat protein [Paludibacter sp.]
MSYDNGRSWTKLGKAVGETGATGAQGEKGDKGEQGDKGDPGTDGDSMFSSVTYDDNYVYFTLADGTVIQIAKGKGGYGDGGTHEATDFIEFKDLAVKSVLLQKDIDINNNGEISYAEAAAYSGFMIIKKDEDIRSFKELQYFTNLSSVSFQECTSLFELVLPAACDSILDYAFYKTKLTSITIPTSCKYIGRYAFNGCSNLRSAIEIPSTCQTIGECAFADCSSLTHVVFQNGCKTIAKNAFKGCKLTDVALPNSVISMEIGAFDCSTLTSFVFPENLTTGANAYHGEKYRENIKPALTTVYWNCKRYMGSESPHLSDYASNLENIIIGEDVEYIPKNFAPESNKMTKIIIPDKVVEIGEYAFDNCSALTTATIGSKVEKIGYSAFQNCTKLYLLYCKNPTPPVLGDDYVFDDTALGLIYVPTNSVLLYKAAWSAYADKIIGYDFD